jgi:hypothetical protein
MDGEVGESAANFSTSSGRAVAEISDATVAEVRDALTSGSQCAVRGLVTSWARGSSI